MATIVDKVEELSLKEDGTTVAATTAAGGETSRKTTEGETHAEGIEGGAPSIGHIKACCGLGRCIVSESEDTPLKHCGQCKQIKYCCREHQVEHFKYGGHKQCCAGRKNAEQEPLVFDKFVQAADTAMKVRDFKTALINYGAMLELTEKNSDIFHPQCANILDQMAKAYKGMQREHLNGSVKGKLNMALKNKVRRKSKRKIETGAGRFAPCRPAVLYRAVGS